MSWSRLIPAVELHNAADHDDCEFDDFMRRRSKIDLVVADDEFVGSDGLAEISQLLSVMTVNESLMSFMRAGCCRH